MATPNPSPKKRALRPQIVLVLSLQSGSLVLGAGFVRTTEDGRHVAQGRSQRWAQYLKEEGA